MQGLASLAAALLICMGLPAVGHGYEPRVNYQLQCMGCHRADGTGESGRVPSVRGTLVRFSMIPAGREFVLRVPGVAQSPLCLLYTSLRSVDPVGTTPTLLVTP